MKSEDIAKLAGVSRGTVSRVLNGKSDVAEATRRKIEKIIEEYGYKPNASARKLAGKPIEIIGFFVYKNRDHQGKKWWLQESPYFVRIMVSLLGAAKKRGYNLLVDIINTEKDFNSIEDYFKSGTVSAGVFMGFDEKVESIENIIKEGYKVSLLDQKKSNNGFDNCILVNADDISGAYKATQYLIDNGHKKIAHINTCNGIAFKSLYNYTLFSASCFSIPFDFLLKISNKGLLATLLKDFPLIKNTKYDFPLISTGRSAG